MRNEQDAMRETLFEGRECAGGDALRIAHCEGVEERELVDPCLHA
ncbi:MAG TPA: hypothetical protein VJP05_06225 [Acidimicrobiia bacterium]|nr:hypothetical protein [Acidimicrobiia bacterium]